MAHLVVPVDLAKIVNTTEDYCQLAKDYRERLFSAIQSLPNRTQTDRVKSVRLATAAVDHCNTLIRQIQIMENVWLTPAPFMEHDSWFEHNANQPDFEEFDVGKLMKKYPQNQDQNVKGLNWSFDNSSMGFPEYGPSLQPEVGKRTQRRAKRQLLIGAGIAAIAGLTAYSTIYFQVQLRDLASQVHRDKQFNIKLVSKLAAEVKFNQRAIDTLVKEIRNEINYD